MGLNQLGTGERVDSRDVNDHLTLRTMLKRAGLGAGAFALPGILAACGAP